MFWTNDVTVGRFSLYHLQTSGKWTGRDTTDLQELLVDNVIILPSGRDITQLDTNHIEDGRSGLKIGFPSRFVGKNGNMYPMGKFTKFY